MLIRVWSGTPLITVRNNLLQLKHMYRLTHCGDSDLAPTSLTQGPPGLYLTKSLIVLYIPNGTYCIHFSVHRSTLVVYIPRL